jgi:bifunctional DNA-binding transcriptional regulator/antitoxin component of YhaV-PrlF toxin-antitoxin module
MYKTILLAYTGGGKKMAKSAVRRSSMERKIISVSGKRQITIPQKYFEVLGFNSEAECILQNNAIVIRPIRENTGNEFSEQILADLIAQGILGKELLEKFKEMSKKVAPAMNKLIDEADSIAKGEKKGATIADIFEAEDK